MCSVFFILQDIKTREENINASKGGNTLTLIVLPHRFSLTETLYDERKMFYMLRQTPYDSLVTSNPKTQRSQIFKLAHHVGIEPTATVLETVMLPLHQWCR